MVSLFKKMRLEEERLVWYCKKKKSKQIRIRLVIVQLGKVELWMDIRQQLASVSIEYLLDFFGNVYFRVSNKNA